MENISPEVRVAARYMNEQLREYRVLSRDAFMRQDFRGVCSYSAELLHELGVEETPEEEFDCNGKAMKGLIKGLRKLVLDSEKSPIDKEKIEMHYLEVSRYLQDVRETLRAVYRKQ